MRPPHRSAENAGIDVDPSPLTKADELVHLVVAERVATITLDSPANRNALSRRLLADLHTALDGAESGIADGSVRVIVLTHTPPVFCAGADLKERAGELPTSIERAGELPTSIERAGQPLDPNPFVDVLTRLMDVAVPTIAAVSGPVRAGGIGLMAACDLVVVDRDVVFALTEVRIGVVAAIISVPILRRASPSHLAAAFLTGEPFLAEAARQAGLVTHVTDDVTTVVDTLCTGIMMGAPGAVAATKTLLRDALDPSLDDRSAAFKRLSELSERLFRGDEAAEGMAAFAAKRPPSWQTAAR